MGGGSFSKDVFVGGILTSSSDIRLKRNISPLKNENESFLEKIKDIKTIRYNYTYDHQNTNHIGFIAQDFVDMFVQLYSPAITLDNGCIGTLEPHAPSNLK
jgi:hypothetical protein